MSELYSDGNGHPFCGLKGDFGAGEATADDVIFFGIEFVLLIAILGTGAGLGAYSYAGRC
ncbi:MAG: hypothetical protein ABI286_02495 [Edaphobacter sp.]